MKEVKPPLFNWAELQRVNRPPMQRQQPGEENRWDGHSYMYNRIASMEKIYTLNQINAFETLSTDTVLDCGCGPGRITVPMAKRAKSVTAMDSAEKMLDYCKENVAAEGLDNVNFKFLDFHDAEPGKNIELHDIVVCSRSEGFSDLQKLSSLSKRLVAIVSWANAPCVPDILYDIFVGTNGQSRLGGPPGDRRLGYNVMFNIVYDLGYEPNVHIVPDGFTQTFLSYEEAYTEMRKLGQVDDDKLDRFKSNLNQWLTENEDGTVTFLRETRSVVIWWEVNPRNYY